jgi:hypothetical protein
MESEAHEDCQLEVRPMSQICLGVLYKRISMHYSNNRRIIEGIHTNMVVSG